MRNLILLISLLLPGLCQADTVYYFVTTNHTHAQVQLDVSHTSSWTFSPNADILLGGGKFIMKEGSSVLDTTWSAFQVWEGPQGGTLRAGETLSKTEFEAAHPGGNDGTFGQLPVPYYVIPTFTLLGGHSYTITLTSNAADAGSQQYFIKDPTHAAFQDGSGNFLTTPPPVYNGPPLVPEVPEPSTWVLMAGGVGLLAISRKYRPKG